MDSSSKIDQAAGDWLARRDAGGWTAAHQADLDRWLDASAMHRVAFLRLEHAWEQALRLKALGAGHRSDATPPPGQWELSRLLELPQKSTQQTMQQSQRRALYKHPLLSWAAAASVLLFVCVFAWNAGYFARGRYSTPVGGLSSIPMKDGSKVTLNTDSEIAIALTAKERRVELRHGEAFFDVAKDPARPFIVSIGDKQVIAVGTQFSVRRDKQDIRVVVTEGKVRVAGRNIRGAAEPLPAGTIARANDANLLLQRKSLSEAEEYLSWRSGVLVFREMTLADAVAEFNRYNEQKITIETPQIAAMRVAGSFRSTNVDAFVRLLQQGYPLHVEHRDGEIVLKGY